MLPNLRLPATLRLLFVQIFVLSMASCAGVRQIVKARPAIPSGFLVQSPDLKSDEPGTGPFHLVRRTVSPAVIKSALRKPAIEVQPVDLRWLKPVRKTMAKVEKDQFGKTWKVKEVAAMLQSKFQQSVNRFGQPQKGNRLILQLALTEFTPTSPAGNVMKTAAGFVVGPLSMLAAPLVNGSLAIEGQLIDPETGRVVFQFADRESDPLTIISVRSFQSAGWAEIIAGQWAEQFALAVRSPAGTKVKDASIFRLNPM